MKKLLLALLFVVGLGWSIASFEGLAVQGQYESIIIDFREDIAPSQVLTDLQQLTQQYKLQPQLNSEFSEADQVYIVPGSDVVLQQLRQTLGKDAEFIEPNYLYHIPEDLRSTSQPSGLALPAVASATGQNDRPSWASSSQGLQVPNDPLYSQQWNLQAINIEAAWLATAGSGAIVAVIDTGVTRVPDLQKTEIIAGYDFVNDRPEADDDNGHGTHVAGTIAQSTNNNYGVAGIAHAAKLMPLKVLSRGGGGSVADIAEAIRFAADHDADVINLSLGGAGESRLMQEAINYAHQKGVVIIAAAGNANQNAAGYPARYPRVIGVAAIDATTAKAPYSNYGAGVDLSAPGGNTSDSEAGGILQETINPRSGEHQFAAFQGTSMAAPHVAAVAALVKSIGIEDPDEITTILQQSARTIAEDPLNHFGAGQLDAAAAVQLADGGRITPRDFARWLRDNGYLNPKFWIDGGVVALPMKLAMVLGSYLLAWFLRNYFPFRWNWQLATGLVVGSSGFFVLRGIYIFDLPQFPLRLAGSSLPELGTAISGNPALNPIFASVLLPGAFLILLLGHPSAKWWAIGTLLGVSASLGIYAIADPHLLWLGNGLLARSFLAVNAGLCFALARLALKPSGGLHSCP